MGSNFAVIIVNPDILHAAKCHTWELLSPVIL